MNEYLILTKLNDSEKKDPYTTYYKTNYENVVQFTHFTSIDEEDSVNWAESIDRSPVQTMDQSNQPYQERENHGDVPTPFTHPAWTLRL